MNVSLHSTALHSTTTESNSTTGEPPNKKTKKEGPVNNDNIAGLYSVQFIIGLMCYKCIIVLTTTECNSVTGKPPTKGKGHAENIRIVVYM